MHVIDIFFIEGWCSRQNPPCRKQQPSAQWATWRSRHHILWMRVRTPSALCKVRDISGFDFSLGQQLQPTGDFIRESAWSARQFQVHRKWCIPPLLILCLELHLFPPCPWPATPRPCPWLSVSWSTSRCFTEKRFVDCMSHNSGYSRVPWDILKCSLFTSTLAWNFWPRNLSFRGAKNDPVVVIWPLVGSCCMARQFGPFSGQMVRSWWSLATWFYGYHPSGGTHSTARGSLDDGQGVVIQWKCSMTFGLNSRFETFVFWILYISFGVWWKFVKRVVLAKCFQWQARESFVVTGTKVGSAMPITKTKVTSKLSFCAMGLSSQIWLLCMFPSTCLSHVSFSDAMPCPCPPARARSLRRRSLLVAADESTWDQFWSGQAFR